MTSSVDRLPAEYRTLLVDILSERDPGLLRILQSTDTPSAEVAQYAKKILQREFMCEIREDSEPTARGKQVDELVGVFINMFTMDQD